ncbi:PolC-type DNA polymerase III [Salisediminibacterium halotolerans]|uniref:DNA polymerase-3 subunit epsilon n=1 Tax=Salisediminibacterium halotolerans TaxID=517425 RepID=A0A1H9RTG7_9BACI|nr:exonuclease domain-containing protein [Salisediminibacterium haloalkalitolerans]SER76092.1 DNA polymerase-3 subunit epsilon [Salisediminibacterium haloalkalitolerans]
MEVSIWPAIRFVLFDYFRFVTHRNQWHMNENHEREKVMHRIRKFQPPVVENRETLEQLTFTVFDLETTGFFTEFGDEIISIGAVKMDLTGDHPPLYFYDIICPSKSVSKQITGLTGLTNEKLSTAERFPSVIARFLAFIDDTVLVAYPASFDVPFLVNELKKWKLPRVSPLYLDARKMAEDLFPGHNNDLSDWAERMNMDKDFRHHALKDACVTSFVFEAIYSELDSRGLTLWGDLSAAWKGGTS